MGGRHLLRPFGKSGFGVTAHTSQLLGGGEGAGKLANLRPSWRVKPGLNPVYYSDTSAEWLEQEMLLR